MSDVSSADRPPENELQFDHVEYAAPAPAATCPLCNQPMQETYYEVNGTACCPGCHDRIQEHLNRGSAFGRFVRATVYGSIAGAIGAGIYYGVRELTNINFGLIAIVVGLMIGNSVKRGSNARGGWFYQGLAMFLTYTAIVSTHIPMLMQAIGNRAAKEEAAEAQVPAKPGDVAEARPAEPAVAKPEEGAEAKPNELAAAEPANAGAKPDQAPEVKPQNADDPAPRNARPPITLPHLLFALVVLTGFAYAIPIWLGFHSPMGLVIVGIALYEAWVTNRRSHVMINGPFRIGRAESEGAAHVEPAG